MAQQIDVQKVIDGLLAEVGRLSQENALLRVQLTAIAESATEAAAAVAAGGDENGAE